MAHVWPSSRNKEAEMALLTECGGAERNPEQQANCTKSCSRNEVRCYSRESKREAQTVHSLEATKMVCVERGTKS